MGLNSILEPIGESIEKITGIIQSQPLASAAIGTGVLVAGGTVAAIVTRKRRKKKATATRKTSKRKTAKRKKSRGKHKHRTSPRGKLTRHTHRTGKRSTKAIHYTRNGQPYKILSSGKARFIKRSSAKRMKKLKGGFR